MSRSGNSCIVGILCAGWLAQAAMATPRPVIFSPPVLPSEARLLAIQQRALEGIRGRVQAASQKGIKCGDPLPAAVTYKGIPVPAGSQFCMDSASRRLLAKFSAPVHIAGKMVDSWTW